MKINLILFILLNILWIESTITSENDNANTSNNNKAKELIQEFKRLSKIKEFQNEAQLLKYLTENINHDDTYTNIKKLLKKGINPNFPATGENALFHIMSSAPDNQLAQNLMELIFEFGANPDMVINNEVTLNDNLGQAHLEDLKFLISTPLELLIHPNISNQIDIGRIRKNLLPWTDQEKINFIKILLKQKATIFNTPLNKALKRENNANNPNPKNSLVIQAIEQLKQEANEKKALEAFMHHKKKNLSIFKAIDNALGH